MFIHIKIYFVIFNILTESFDIWVWTRSKLHYSNENKSTIESSFSSYCKILMNSHLNQI